jgi:hypothetical protein
MEGVLVHCLAADLIVYNRISSSTGANLVLAYVGAKKGELQQCHGGGRSTFGALGN